MPGKYTLADVQDQPKQQGKYTLADTEGTPPTPPSYQAGGLHAFGSDLWNAVAGIPSTIYTGLQLSRGIVPPEFAGQLANLPADYAQRQQAGYNLPYRLTAPALELGMGTNVKGMEEAARQGDPSGVLGHMAAGQVVAAAPLGVEGVVRGANRVVPSTTRSGLGLKMLETSYAEHPIEPAQAVQAARDIQARLDITGEKPHPIVQTFLDRVEANDLAAAHPEAGIQANPLTFKEARTFLKRANELKYDTGIGQPAKNQLSQFAGALDKDITSGVAQPSDVAPQGFLPDYQRMQTEYRRGSKLIRGAESRMGRRAAGTVGAALGATVGQASGIPHGGWGGAGLGYALAEPVVGSLVRSVIEREAGAPRLSVPPAPPTGSVPLAGEPPIPPAEGGPPALPQAGRRMAEISVLPGEEQRSGFERRTNAAERTRISAMTPEQVHQALYTSKLGIPNARAFAEAPSAPAYGFSDVAGLKWLNDTYGSAAGDALLQAKARALQDAGVEAYHTGGDEFQMRGADQSGLAQKLQQAQQNLRDSIIEVTDPKTGKIEHYTGAEFRYGVGSDAKAAEASMMGEKAKAKSTRGTQGAFRRVSAASPPTPPMEVPQ